MPDLSINQKQALKLARENGGELRLYDHGRWKGRITGMNTEVVKASTVDSLVKRRLLVLAGYRLGRPTKAVLPSMMDKTEKPVVEAVCCRCEKKRKVAGKTWNGKDLCGECIAETKGLHLDWVAPNKRGYGRKQEVSK
jgi:hypothetical protein